MGEENDEPLSMSRGVPLSLGRSDSLSVSSGRYGGAGVGLGGDGSMGRGVIGIKEGDEVIGTSRLAARPAGYQKLTRVSSLLTFTGMKGRRRLPLASSSLNSISSPSSLRLSTATIERTRKEIIAEEYLTHVGEALQWVEGVLQKDLGFGVVEFEEKLRDGVVLARMAEKVGAKGGNKIFEVSRLPARSSDHEVAELTALPRSCRTPNFNGDTRTTLSCFSTSPSRPRSAYRRISSLRRLICTRKRTCPRSSFASTRLG